METMEYFTPVAHSCAHEVIITSRWKCMYIVYDSPSCKYTTTICSTIHTLYVNICRPEFVVCECSWFKELSTLPGSCVELVSERQELEGYKVAMVKDWVLNRPR